jgi:DNA-binding transcriptional MerR regulator
MSATFTITDLAREFGITTRTLRFYEAQGILCPERRGRARIFSARDRGRLRIALRGRRLGLTISDLRELFDRYDAACADPAHGRELAGILAARREALERQRQDIDVMLDEIAFFEAQCRRLGGAR